MARSWASGSPFLRRSRCLWLIAICAFYTLLVSAHVEAVAWKRWLHKGKESASEAIEWAGYYTGIGGQCVFVDKPAVSVREYLQKNLVAQDRAIESVVGAVESWEFSRKSSKDRTPMVLAITGPTGTGKTEMSNLLAESLFKRTRKLPNSEKKLPTGLLIFRGEDFSDSFSNPITEYHTQIKTRLVEHLQFCSGKAVVLFDEVQKVIPHTLDAIMEAVSDRAQLTYYKNGVSKTIDTSNVIFILVSDIGVAEMEHVIINYENREDVPPAELENAVKGALDAQWARLSFGKMVDQVIPFLPFEHMHVAQIIDLKLRQLDANYRGVYWHRLWIEPGLDSRMSLSDSMKYVVRKASVSGTVTSQKIYAVYGARSVETGPIQQLKSKLLRYLRPFNPESEVRVLFDAGVGEVVIQSCGPEDPTKKLTDRAVDGEMISVSCAIKWQDRCKLIFHQSAQFRPNNHNRLAKTFLCGIGGGFGEAAARRSSATSKLHPEAKGRKRHVTPPSTQSMSSLESSDVWGGAEEGLDPEILLMGNDELRQRIRLLDNDIRIMRSDIQRINHETNSQRERIKENNEKVKLNKQLPYLVGNVVEILELEDDEDEQDGAATDVDAQRTGKSAVIKTSTRQTIFLPIPGLVDSDKLVPNDLVGTNKDSYLILEKLPAEYDSRVKAMEVDEKPTEEYSDIGGLDKQIQELVEAVVLPMTHREKFEAIGIQPPKGVLLHGPPGTGKTLLARACAKQTDAIFLKLAAPQLVQMFIGDGAKLVRDAFELAKEKCKDKDKGGAIIFIDELDAIGTKRFGGEQSGDREVQRTMLELLNQLDGFTANTKIKVIAATNRPDVLDPALLRSGRLDRKIELPHPTEEARARILQIHSRKMNVDMDDVNFDELARCTDDFNGAQLKAVCVEAGMLALRRDSSIIKHEDFMEGIGVVSAKKKTSLQYYA